MKQSPWVFTHPKQEDIKKEHWLTICWNTAWIAADSVLSNLKKMGGT
jgi:hypothetical protein